MRTLGWLSPFMENNSTSRGEIGYAIIAMYVAWRFFNKASDIRRMGTIIDGYDAEISLSAKRKLHLKRGDVLRVDRMYSLLLFPRYRVNVPMPFNSVLVLHTVNGEVYLNADGESDLKQLAVTIENCLCV